MKRITTVLTLLLWGTSSWAALQPLVDQDMSMVDGQAGIFNPLATSATLSLDFRLNLESDYSNVCASGVVSCNLGVGINGRYVGATGTTDTKQWLVFKNVTGGINIPQMIISGQQVDVGVSGTPDLRPALTFSFDKTKPIIIKKLGFESLAVETDSAVEVNPDGSLNLGNTSGYRNAVLAAPAGSATNVFDAGKFRGFIGLDMTASVAINGNLKVFACDASLPRC